MLARIAALALLSGLPLACASRESVGTSSVSILGAGVVNDPANKSLRFDLLKFGLDGFCKEMLAAGVPLKMSDDEPVMGRFQASACQSQILDEENRKSFVVQYSGSGYAANAQGGRVTFTTTGLVEYARLKKLHEEGTISDSHRDSAELVAESAGANLRRVRAGTKLARADLRRAQEDLELTVVRSPVNGQVLQIHTREGEKAGADGIAEIADTGQMYAVAEVYETDIAKVRVGQRATVTLAQAGEPLSGIVERVALKVGKLDVLGTDPVARTDARVVEVDILMDDSRRVSGMTNMQVTVTIDVSSQPAA